MTINLNGKLMDLSLPKVMGILNVTPDSFYDGGKFSSDKKVLDQVEKMILDGADIIDIGGYSSKPGAKEVKTKEEINRVIPTIELIKNKFSDIILSIDTFRSRVAQKAVQSGASLINDISAGELDSNMFKCVAELKVPYILMHMQGNPQNMQKNPSYKNVINEHETTIYVEEALHRLVELHYKIGLENEAKKYAQLLGYNYLSSDWYKNTYKIFNNDYKLANPKARKKESSYLIKKYNSIFKRK